MNTSHSSFSFVNLLINQQSTSNNGVITISYRYMIKRVLSWHGKLLLKNHHHGLERNYNTHCEFSARRTALITIRVAIVRKSPQMTSQSLFLTLEVVHEPPAQEKCPKGNWPSFRLNYCPSKCQRSSLVWLCYVVFTRLNGNKTIRHAQPWRRVFAEHSQNLRLNVLCSRMSRFVG